MPWKPSVKLYESDGATLQYTFEHVIDIPDLYTDQPEFTELTNKRSSGSIIIPAGDQPYDFRIRGVLTADDYTALVSAMSTLKSSIENNTRYVLKIDTSNTTTEDLKVMRLSPIIWEGPEKKTKIQYYTVTFRVLTWS